MKLDEITDYLNQTYNQNTQDEFSITYNISLIEPDTCSIVQFKDGDAICVDVNKITKTIIWNDAGTAKANMMMDRILKSQNQLDIAMQTAKIFTNNVPPNEASC